MVREQFRYAGLLTFAICLLLSNVGSLHSQNPAVSQDIYSYRISCDSCTSPLEISGLTRFKNYLFILPQKQNFLYVYDLNNLDNTNTLKRKKITFSYKKKPVGSEGWEAIAFREISGDSLEFYFALEKCEGRNFCLLKASASLHPNKKMPVKIEPLTPFGGRITANGNLSYEAITWLQHSVYEGVLIIPEKLLDKRLKPVIVTESGKLIDVIADSSLYNLRISDMAAHPFLENTYLACSFCWKGKDSDFSTGNTWCFNNNDKWESRLTLVSLKIEVNKTGRVMLYAEKRKEFNEEFIKIKGPNPQKQHEYNAEGLAITQTGKIIMVNDNSPDGAYTELRVLPKKYLFENVN